MSTESARLPIWLLAAALAFVIAAPADAARPPYRRGETIEITGTVADAGGAPVGDVRVVLLAAHRGFTVRGMRWVEEGLVRVPTRTDAQGRFRIEWRWDSYYDLFRVRVEGMAPAPAGTSASTQGGRQMAVLAEVDLASRLDQGNPVVVALEVADAATHRDERAFTAAPQSDDQKRVFEEMGKPDRVDRLEMPGGDEVTWWYFERGKSYHFREGRLDQVMEFEPMGSSVSGSPGDG